jgi:pyrimidine-nucleoside phosphorylase
MAASSDPGFTERPGSGFGPVLRRARLGLSRPEDMALVAAAAAGGDVPDYQLSAWLMAVAIKGLDEACTVALTRAMAASGGTPAVHPGLVDKHSTGGVGDKTTLVVAPLVASLGVPVAKMSGRGLGHTGGTLDKLESIPGFNVHLPRAELARVVAEVGVAVGAQSEDLAPADGRLYALRDVTETVDSRPLIASSIMAKKLAGGSPAILLDVKVGRGAFMTDLTDARALARLMLHIAHAESRRAEALLTDMDQPLGYAVGNAIEVNEARATLMGEGPPDFECLVLAVAARMLALAGRPDNAEQVVRQQLASGRAFRQFLAWIRAQGGDDELMARGPLPLAPVRNELPAPASGVVESVDPLAAAQAALRLGAGRRRKEDPVDHAVGVRVLVKVGQSVTAGEPLAEIYAQTAHDSEEARELILEGIKIGAGASPRPIVLEHLTE